MLKTLIKFTENDKRLLIAFFLVFILLLLVLGVFYDLIKRWMGELGKKVDEQNGLLVDRGFIKSKKQFKRIARRKSNKHFFKQLSFGLLFILIIGIIHVSYWLIIVNVFEIEVGLFNLNSYLFEYEKTGFGTILYIFDFKNAPRVNFFGLNIISNWPGVISRPHFEIYAIGSYILVPSYLILFSYLIVVFLGYLSRTIQIIKSSRILFSVDLSKRRLYNLSEVAGEEKGPINKPNIVSPNSDEVN